jgi:hypothetical protein
MSGKEAAKAKGQAQEQKKKGTYQKWHRQGQTEGKKKDPEAIPVLKYGPSNNYTIFKEALSNAALKEYGTLGKLIKQGEEFEFPQEPNVDEYDLEDDPYGINKATYIEDLKEYRKEASKMKENGPKLYGLITQYLSEESLDEVKRQDKWEEIDEAADPDGLWRLVEETHKVNTISKVIAVTKLAARKTYKGTRQGNFESIIAYKQRFNAALKTYNDQKNTAIEEVDIAMDFFSGLDDARYASFKAEIVNGLTAGSIVQPKDLNAMYLLANQWLKTAKSHPTGLATTFNTTLDLQDPQDNKKSKGDRKQKAKGGKKKQDEKTSGKKDMSEVECFNCGIMGHYANACPHRMEKKKRAESDDEDDERLGHVTWADASTFSTYQVNAVSETRFARTEVVLDNAADVSVVHPSLLRNIVEAEREVKINGVGGHQFTVRKTGFLDPFFPVYASEHTKANILSFAQVEDKYPITFKQQDSFTVHLPHVDVVFKRREGMYVADWTDYKQVFNTQVCTKAEEE